jgi:hypothetical protein
LTARPRNGIIAMDLGHKRIVQGRTASMIGPAS